MSAFPRYAIYYVPARDSALYRFGAETLGYDAFTGNDVAIPADIARLPDWNDIVRDPQTYGFHATLKAPFALANGSSHAELAAACAEFCASPRDIPRIELIVAAISGFIALVPAQPSPALAKLASDLVEAFDAFRAPLSASERARRNPTRLTERQITYLDRWGYPYVMEEFRFHMTLTGRLTPERGDAVRAMLTYRFSRTALAQTVVDRIALLRQDTPEAHFHTIGEYLLTSS